VVAQISGPTAGSESSAKPSADIKPKSGPSAPRNLEPLPPGKYTGILGKKVAGPDGKDLGLVVDVIVDVDGGRAPPSSILTDFSASAAARSRSIGGC
jgi:hypothetical protein